MLLGVPVDIVSPEKLPDVLSGFLHHKKKPAASKTGIDIVLLSLWDFLRARRNNEYRNYVLNAALVIPISKSLVSGARFLLKKEVFRYMPFKFVITLLTLLEKEEHSLYLFGGTAKVLRKAEKNIRMTFPRLKIVGRCEGAIRKQNEDAVIEAIRKASPSLLLAGKGMKGKELWIHRNSKLLNQALRLWCSDLLDVFAEKKRRPSDFIFDRGLECIGYCFGNPFKIFRIFPWLRYKLLLLWARLFSK